MSTETHHIPPHLTKEQQTPSEENLALFKATSENNIAKIRTLLAKGASPNYFSHPNEQKNALHISAEKGYLEAMELLIAHGATVNAIAATDQSSAIILATRQHNVEVLRKLVSEGADIHHENGYGNTALHEASKAGHYPQVILLLEAGANPNKENHKGSTSLHMFCYNADATDERIATELIKHGAEVNAKDHRGLTPLLVSCTTGRIDTIELLLKHGADLHAVDNEGRGAKEIARFYHQHRVMDWIESHESRMHRADGKSNHDGNTASKSEGKNHKH